MSRSKTLTRERAEVNTRQSQKAPPRPRAFRNGKVLHIIPLVLWGVLLAGATIALYSPLNDSLFIHWDAENLVTGNPHIQNGLSWSTIKWAFTSTDAWNWQPLTWISHGIDYQLFGSNPGDHHLVSVLIHALNAVVLFLLLAWATKRVGPSLFVAALFALHPLNVESVAWITERKSLLSLLFSLLSIGAYMRYVRKPDWRRYLQVAAMFAAALMAKSMAITLPFVLLLLDYWPLERVRRDETMGATNETSGNEPALPSTAARKSGSLSASLSSLVLEKVPLLFLSVLSAVIAVKAQARGHAVRGLHQFSLAVRLENAVVAYWLYLWKMIWPARLALLYPHPGSSIPVWQWTLATLALTSVTVLVIRFRGKGYLPVGWFWFLGTAIPVIGLVQVGPQAMADRYAYVPLIGIFIMVAWGLDDWARAKDISAPWRIAPALCTLAALSFVTSHQLSYWKNEYTVWAHTLAVTQRNSYALDTVGAALIDPGMAATASSLDGLDTEQKRIDEARHHWEEALALNQKLLREHPEAEPQYDMAMELSDLGFLDRIQNRLDEAHQNYEEALNFYRQLASQKPDIYLPRVTLTLDRLGNVDRLRNRMDEAVQHYDDELKMKRQLAERNPAIYLPDFAMTLNEVGLVDATQNHADEARQHFEEALRIQRQLAEPNPALYLPYIPMTLNNLGNLDRQQNRIDEARADYQEALSVLQKLSQVDSKYAAEMTKVEASLRELDTSGIKRGTPGGSQVRHAK